MKKILSVLLSSAALIANADNPLITTMYTADPTARVINGKLFVFPSSDVDPVEGKGNNGFYMPYYHIFSSENLMDWTDYGKQIDQNDVPWGETDSYAMWAPDCIEMNGKFYYYFPDQPKGDEKTHFVGVAVANKPEGPYKVEKKPIAGAVGIDPSVFIDDDGTPYLYWGSGDFFYGCKLKKNMKELDGTPVEIKGTPPMYKEASFMFKRDGKYYFTFSHLTPFRTCELSYCVGDSPLGEFHYKGAFMDRWDWCWTNHHSFVNYKGDWMLFYHHCEISNNSKKRSIQADYVTFDKYGNINKVVPTMRGIGICDANREIQIDRYSEKCDKDVTIKRLGKDFPANWIASDCQNKGWLSYNRVDFGNKKYSSVVVRCSSAQGNGAKTMTIRENGFVGNVIAKVDIPSTGDNYKYTEVVVPLTSCPKGLVNLYLMFDTQDNNTFNVDWIKFQE